MDAMQIAIHVAQTIFFTFSSFLVDSGRIYTCRTMVTSVPGAGITALIITCKGELWEEIIRADGITVT
jgi:hypothetical protein